MSRYFIKRLLLGLFALFFAMFLTYMLMAAFLDNPVKVTGKNDAAAKLIIARNHLDSNPIVRFFYYVKGLFSGDLGQIFVPGVYQGETIPQLFFGKLKYSILITAPAFVLSTFLGFVFGLISGYKRGTWIDTAINVFVIVFVAIPSFILAIIALLFADKLGFITTIFTDKGFITFIKGALLPILLLTVSSFAGMTYYIRNEVVGVLSSDFIKTARGKGLSETTILFRHVLRNVMIPVSGMIIGGFMTLLSGSFVLEKFFGLDGTATFLVQSVKQNEINVVMFQLLVFASLGVLITILIDFSYVALDPRITLASSNKPSVFSKAQAWNKRKKEAKNV